MVILRFGVIVRFEYYQICVILMFVIFFYRFDFYWDFCHLEIWIVHINSSCIVDKYLLQQNNKLTSSSRNGAVCIPTAKIFSSCVWCWVVMNSFLVATNPSWSEIRTGSAFFPENHSSHVNADVSPGTLG